MTILKFYADWCNPCKQLSKTIETFNKEHPEIEITSINVDDNEDLVDKYSIRTVPTLVKLNDENIEISRKVGAVSYKELEDFIFN